MTERTIKGQIAQWSEVKTGLKNSKSWYKVSCNINGEWHSMFVPTPEDGETIIKSNPINSDVEFIEIQSGDFWNYKKDSWNMIKEGTGTANTSQKSVTTKSNDGVDWDSKERRIIRQNCLTHADNFLNYLQISGQLAESKPEEIKEAYLRFAKTCEEWVYREEPKPEDPITKEESVI